MGITEIITFWNVSSKNCTGIRFSAHEQGVNSLNYLGNKQLLSSGQIDNTVKLWDLTNNSLINSFVGPAGPVPIGRLLADEDNSPLISYLSSKNYIITCGYGAVYVWNKQNVSIAKGILVNKTINSLQVIQEKDQLIVQTADSVYFLNLDNYNLSLISQNNESLSAVVSYKNSSDNKNYLVQGNVDGSVQVFQIIKYSGDGSNSGGGSGGSDESKAWIAGVVIGVLAGIIILGICIACIVKKNRKKNEDNGYKHFNDTQVSKGQKPYSPPPEENQNQNQNENEKSEENEA